MLNSLFLFALEPRSMPYPTISDSLPVQFSTFMSVRTPPSYRYFPYCLIKLHRIRSCHRAFVKQSLIINCKRCRLINCILVCWYKVVQTYKYRSKAADQWLCMRRPIIQAEGRPILQMHCKPDECVHSIPLKCFLKGIVFT